MRAVSLSVLVSALLATSVAWADPECSVVAEPGLRVDGKMVFFDAGYRCDAGATGSASLRFERRGPDGKSSVFEKAKKRTLGPSRRDYPWSIEDKGFGVCASQEKGPMKGAKLVGPPGKELLSYPVPVTAVLEGEGALAGISGTWQATGWCPLCRAFASYRNRVYLRLPDRKPPFLEVELDPEWANCARRAGDLQLRIFLGDSRKEVENALRPTLVMNGLEKRIDFSGKKIKEKLPMKSLKLCSRGKSWVAWELSGRGELKRAGGGGRSRQQLRCR